MKISLIYIMKNGYIEEQFKGVPLKISHVPLVRNRWSKLKFI
jgi:hypothetical protein